MKILKTFTEPTTLFIGDFDYHDETPNKRSLMIDDDETGINTKSGSEEGYLNSLGFIHISTLEEIRKYIESVNKLNLDLETEFLVSNYLVLKDYVGTICLSVKDESGDEIEDYEINDYITHQLNDVVITLCIKDGYNLNTLELDELINLLDSKDNLDEYKKKENNHSTDSVINAILGERMYQEKGKSEKDSHIVEDFPLSSGLLAIEHNLNIAKQLWYKGNSPHTDAMEYVRKIAAISIQMGETYGMPERGE